METKVSVRHFDPPGQLKEEIGMKLEKEAGKHFRSVIEAAAVISMEDNRYYMEADVKVKGISFHAHDEDYNVHDCVEKTLKKLETQMRRYKDRKVSLKKKQKRNGAFDENSGLS